MVCYIVPTVAAIVHNGFRKKHYPNSSEHQMLNRLLLGGAIFGIVDHWWNGQLFYSPNLLKDLALGVTITCVIMLVWFGLVHYERLGARNQQQA